MKHLNMFIAASALAVAANVSAGEYTVAPAPGVVDELSQFVIKFDNTGLDEVELDSYSVQVLKDGQPFSDVKKKGYGFEFTCTLNTPATEAGVYEVVIEEYGITYYANDYADVTFNEEPVSFAYTIGSGSGNVVFDVEFTKFRPAEGDVDLEMVQFDNFAMYTSGSGLVLNEGAAVTITSNFGYEEVAAFRSPYAGYYWAPLDKMIVSDGTYTVTIPAATVVDAEYIETDGQSGHANAETTVVYNVINGEPAGEPVVYDLTLASVRPAEGVRDLTMDVFDSITLTLPGDCAFSKDMFTLVMSAPEEQGDITLDFTSSWNGNIAFFTEPTYDGEYVLVIPEGLFGDATWLADANYGHANAEIILKWTLTGGIVTGVEVIENDAVSGPVYNLQGIRVADSLREAGSGLFIVNGKKVKIVK